MENIKEESKKEECVELKHIQYKSMLLNGVVINETSVLDNMNDLNVFLENEKKNNSFEPWSKLDKTKKLQKLLVFAEKFKEDNMLSDEEKENMIIFIKSCLDKKKLQRIKDVIYDKETGNIVDVPSISYNKNMKHFTLKNVDKRISTSKSLSMKHLKNNST